MQLFCFARMPVFPDTLPLTGDPPSGTKLCLRLAACQSLRTGFPDCPSNTGIRASKQR